MAIGYNMHSVSVCFAHINENEMIFGEWWIHTNDIWCSFQNGSFIPFQIYFLFFFFVFFVFYLFYLFDFSVLVAIFNKKFVSFPPFPFHSALFTHSFLCIFWILKFWNYFHIHGHLCIWRVHFPYGQSLSKEPNSRNSQPFNQPTMLSAALQAIV